MNFHRALPLNISKTPGRQNRDFQQKGGEGGGGGWSGLGFRRFSQQGGS